MNNHHLPSNPTPHDIKVPYVCTEPYDGDDVSKYPERKGKLWMAANEDSVSIALHQRNHPMPVRKWEVFLQVWLSFGVLHTFLGRFFVHNDYAVTEEDDQYVTTAKLTRDSERLYLAFQQSNSRLATATLNGFSSCFRSI